MLENEIAHHNTPEYLDLNNKSVLLTPAINACHLRRRLILGRSHVFFQLQSNHN